MLAYLIGMMICRRLLPRCGLPGSVVRTAGFTAPGGGLMLAADLNGGVSLWPIVIPRWIDAPGRGVHQPCGQPGAVTPFPHAAGLASGLADIALAVCGIGVSLRLGADLVGTAPRLYGFTFAALAALAVLVPWTQVRRDGEPPRS